MYTSFVKGILLAGGKGTRLFPTTLAVSKQLLPLYDKPMVYYPLTTLLLAEIVDILVISSPEDLPLYRKLLKNGSQWGVRISYAEQNYPRGLADAFLVGRKFVEGGPSCLILGDNVFFGHDLPRAVARAAKEVRTDGGGAIFGYPVRDPDRYGVVELDREGRPVSIEEKPKAPKSRLAVPGLYFYDSQVLDIAGLLKPSPRGEIEITDVNLAYMRAGRLRVFELGRGTAWLDAGTHESLLQAANFVHAVEERQGMMIGCPEEAAYRMGYIDRGGLEAAAALHVGSSYGGGLQRLLDEGH